jgi:hypothetical protein
MSCVPHLTQHRALAALFQPHSGQTLGCGARPGSNGLPQAAQREASPGAAAGAAPYPG